MKILKLEINDRIHYTLNFDTPQRKNANFIIPRGEHQLFSFRNTIEERVVIATQKNQLQLPVYYEMVFPVDEAAKAAEAAQKAQKLADKDKSDELTKRAEKAAEEAKKAAKDAEEDPSPILMVYLREKLPAGAQKRIIQKPQSFDLTDGEWASLENTDKLRVVFCYFYSEKDEPIKRQIDITFCERDLIFDVVLDFGSEASQMSIVSRNKDIGSEAITSIFSSMKTRYGEKDTKDGEYVQFCDKQKLYRSIYYIKKSIETSDSPDPWSPGADKDKIMSLLSKRNELEVFQREYIPLPNAKIAQFGGVSIPQIEVGGVPMPIKDYGNDYFYRRAVDSFIYEALYAIKNTKGGRKKAVNICILMPNVYSLYIIKEKLGSLYEDIKKMLVLKEFKDIIGFELGYASESDASMLGYFAAEQFRAFRADPGNYLIIDAGKGTLDFSILEYDPRHKKMYRNLCRSGIVGAGNAITYAVMLALVYEFLYIHCQDFIEKEADEQVKQVVFDKILKADLAEQFKFFHEVEKYKFTYNAGDFQHTQAPDRVQDITIDKIEIQGLTNAISGWKHRIADPKRYITSEILCLVMDALRKLNQVTNRIESKKSQVININKVIFTGRGFLMGEFREKFLEGLKTIEPNIEEVKFSEEGHEKDICLYIAGLLSGGTYDVSLEGTPVLLEKIITTPDNAATNRPKPKEKNRGSSDLINSIIDGLFQDSVQTKKTERVAEKVTDLEKKGARLSSYNDLFNIGGVPYTVPKIPENYLGKETRLFFDGEEFLLVAGGQEYRFPSQRVNLQKWHDFQSMFPNVLIDAAADVVLPNNEAVDIWEELINGADNDTKAEKNVDTPPVEGADSSQDNDAEDEHEEEAEGGFMDNLKITLGQIASKFKKDKTSKNKKLK